MIRVLKKRETEREKVRERERKRERHTHKHTHKITRIRELRTKRFSVVV